MTPRALLLAIAFFAPLGQAAAEPATRHCNSRTDSSPASLGADGWAAVDGAVTGGCGAASTRIFHVHDRAQLVAALTKTKHQKGKRKKGDALDHAAKIIYVHGTIDANVDDRNIPLTEEDYMRMCRYTAHDTFYDPVTHDQTGSGGFFGAYKAAYDPNLWIRQSLDPADNRPPALHGALEEARICFQRQQAKRVVIDVGANTSLIGVGADARIVNGTLRLGYVNQVDPDDPDGYATHNVVIRNIAFADAFDMFPSWDPKDSFSIILTNVNGCQAVYDAATDAGPHRCVFRGGRWNAEYDSISVMNARRIWIDHNTFTDEPRFDSQFPPVFAAPFNEATQKVQHHDGQADVTLLGTRVTLSNNVFIRHDKTNLLGGNDLAGLVPSYGPGKIDVTFHGNYYQDTVQRMPRVRFGRVHVYNNFYDLDRRAGSSYRQGDAWLLGTAAKLYTENNLIDIRNNNLTVPRIINYGSLLVNRDACVSAGFPLAQCGTYYYDQGTYVTMITATASTTQLLDMFAAAQAVQQAGGDNAPLMPLDPGDPAVYWTPNRTYAYELLPVGTADEQAVLRARVLDSAGAGRL